MSESFFQAICTLEIAPGGIRAIEINGRQLIICNADGKFYALSGQLQQLQKEKDEKETQWLEIELLKSSL